MILIGRVVPAFITAVPEPVALEPANRYTCDPADGTFVTTTHPPAFPRVSIQTLIDCKTVDVVLSIIPISNPSLATVPVSEPHTAVILNILTPSPVIAGASRSPVLAA